MALRIDSVQYSPINSNDVYLGRKRGLLIYIQSFNRTIADNNITISNKESLVEYYKVIISVEAWSNLIKPEGLYVSIHYKHIHYNRVLL